MFSFGLKELVTGMTASSFNIVLPSNSNPEIYPNNTPSQYSVEFSNPITINNNYEVALSEITYHNDINFLHNNSIEIYSAKYNENVFQLCRNEGFLSWKFNSVKLSTFALDLNAGKIFIAPEEGLAKPYELKPDSPFSRDSVMTSIGLLFQPIYDIFIITMDKSNRPLIMKNPKCNKKMALLLDKEYANTLGYDFHIFSTEQYFVGKGFQKDRSLKSVSYATLLPLYALENKKIIVKHEYETLTEVKDILNRLKSLIPKDKVSVELVKDNVITFKKNCPMKGNNGCIIELDTVFLMGVHCQQTPILCHEGDLLSVEIIPNGFDNSIIQSGEWSLTVYSDNINFQKLDKVKELKKRLNITSGLVKTPEQLCILLNAYVDLYGIKLSYSSNSDRIELTVSYGNEIRFDRVLRSLLGLVTDKIVCSGKTLAENNPNLERDFYNFYIYCNIVEYTRVGNIAAPLLRTLPLSSSKKQLINREFFNKMYVPINRNVINRIDITICDDVGKIIPFRSGNTVLTLHFRPQAD